MRVCVRPHVFSDTIRVPPSKSHTIRQLFIASFAHGESIIANPLDSMDTQSCVAACHSLGATITERRVSDAPGKSKLISYVVQGNCGQIKPCSSSIHIDAGNSGTTLFFAMAAAGLGSTPVVLTGDDLLKRRSTAPLLEALGGLGIHAESKYSNGCAPVVVQGPWKGGKISLSCPTSQYLSAILLAAPLSPAGTYTEVSVPLLNERPYIEMTLACLNAQNIPWQGELNDVCPHFSIPGGGAYQPFSTSVPGDFSSAAFLACAAAVTGGPVTLLGLAPNDYQGDKYFLEILVRMGCSVRWEQIAGSASEYTLTISRQGTLNGGTFDLNAVPDLLPAAAIAAAFAKGDTALVNIAHTRIKETDRITVMAEELAKLGIRCTELPDSLIVHGGGLHGVSGGSIDSRGDHRIAMAFAAAALAAQAPVEIDSAECTAISFPGFWEIVEGEAVGLNSVLS
ncbi:MAG: 3-phosphoshikimate 1-carboxyvinyltransferase [Treponema sp.]|nr:3-phosphoshikimate 1-carboxyvinyltransferase [Treponema sp.]